MISDSAPPTSSTPQSTDRPNSSSLLRTLLLVSNAVVAVVFMAFFAYTFLGRQQIDDRAREFVTERTEKMATRSVAAAEQALRSNLSSRLLSKTQQAAIEAEIAAFRAEPKPYIQRLTAADAPALPRTGIAAVADKVGGWKERVRAHYNAVLRRLITDLRIFSGSNVVAAGIAFACVWFSRGRPSLPLRFISAVLLFSIGFATLSYVSDMSFFTILFDGYMGWSYPAMLASLFLYLYFNYRSDRSPKPPDQT